jgi:hypothetical protein
MFSNIFEPELLYDMSADKFDLLNFIPSLFQLLISFK